MAPRLFSLIAALCRFRFFEAQEAQSIDNTGSPLRASLTVLYFCFSLILPCIRNKILLFRARNRSGVIIDSPVGSILCCPLRLDIIGWRYTRPTLPRHQRKSESASIETECQRKIVVSLRSGWGRLLRPVPPIHR